MGVKDVAPVTRSDHCLEYRGTLGALMWGIVQMLIINLLLGGLAWMSISDFLAGEGANWIVLVVNLGGLLFCLSELSYSLWWLPHAPYRVLLNPAAGIWETSDWRGRIAEITQVDLEGVQRGMGHSRVKVVLVASKKRRVVLGLFPDLDTAESVARYFDSPITLKRLSVRGLMRDPGKKA